MLTRETRNLEREALDRQCDEWEITHRLTWRTIVCHTVGGAALIALITFTLGLILFAMGS